MIAHVVPKTLFGIFMFAQQLLLLKSQFLGEFIGNAEISIIACNQQNVLAMSSEICCLFSKKLISIQYFAIFAACFEHH